MRRVSRARDDSEILPHLVFTSNHHIMERMIRFSHFLSTAVFLKVLSPPVEAGIRISSSEDLPPGHFIMVKTDIVNSKAAPSLILGDKTVSLHKYFPEFVKDSQPGWRLKKII